MLLSDILQHLKHRWFWAWRKTGKYTLYILNAGVAGDQAPSDAMTSAAIALTKFACKNQPPAINVKGELDKSITALSETSFLEHACSLKVEDKIKFQAALKLCQSEKYRPKLSCYFYAWWSQCLFCDSNLNDHITWESVFLS